MKNILKTNYLVTGIFLVNVILRVIYILYGYIPNEEGILLYGQKLAYSGFMPFVDYNAWNSLFNNYVVGWYQFFLQPTILTQRFFGLFSNIFVLFLILYICKKLYRPHMYILTSLFITFGSYTYLYYSTVPDSMQNMSVSLVLSLAFLASRLKTTYLRFTKANLALFFGIFAVVIRPQALFSTFVIFVLLLVEYRKESRKIIILLLLGIFTGLLFYAPYILKSWDHFIYSFVWPLKANEILVYQQGITNIGIQDIFSFGIDVFREYGLFVIFLCPSVMLLMYQFFRKKNPLPKEEKGFLITSFLVAMLVAFPALIHKPPYASYIYPAIPIFAYLTGYAICHYILKSQSSKTLAFSFYGLIIGILLNYLILFPHADYMKTSWTTIKYTPHFYLKEITEDIGRNTTDGSEILAFYIPAVFGLNRYIPVSVNEGEGSLSILTDELSRKYHLTNISMLRSYLTARQAEAVVLTNNTARFLGITQQERDETMKILENNYSLLRTYESFAKIGNPRVKYLYLYKRK